MKWFNIPIIGWIIAIVVDTFAAIPTYFLWNYIAPKYIYQLPEVYQNIPFWDIVWLFMLISILKSTFYPKTSFEIKNS